MLNVEIDSLSYSKANASNQATIETNASAASQAYAVGKYLVLGGILYKVTSAISQGGAIVTSGASQNVEAVTIGDELVSLNTSLAQEKITRAKNGAHNLMPLSLSVIRARNTYGTWNGNTYTQNNVSFAVATDANGNVTGITVNGNGSNTSAVSLEIMYCAGVLLGEVYRSICLVGEKD